MPRGSSQRQSPWGTLSILEEMKAAFCRCEARCLKLLCFGPKSFLGTKSLISSASNRKHTAACQAPAPGGPPARWHSAQLRGTEAPVAGVRERVVFIICTDGSFSVLRPGFREVPVLKFAALILVLLPPPS